MRCLADGHETHEDSMSDEAGNHYISLTADVVSAYVSNNSVPSSELGNLITACYTALSGLNAPKQEQPAEKPQPAVNPKKSVFDEYIICLEDGKKYKSLKRHLRSKYDMSPEDYRKKWGLSSDYPMVAPSYAAARSELARNMGLGRKAGQARGGRGKSAKAA